MGIHLPEGRAYYPEVDGLKSAGEGSKKNGHEESTKVEVHLGVWFSMPSWFLVFLRWLSLQDKRFNQSAGNPTVYMFLFSPASPHEH